MTYIPKSKINIKDAVEGELMFKHTKKPYIGKYIELSNGSLHAGVDVLTLGEKLILTETTTSNLDNNLNAQIYSILNKPKNRFLKDTKTVQATKLYPTDTDYNRGYYIRYFARKKNEQFGYLEINQDIYKSIFLKRTEYDHNLYQVGNIEWSVISDNSKTLDSLQEQWPLLSLLFNNPLEFLK